MQPGSLSEELGRFPLSRVPIAGNSLPGLGGDLRFSGVAGFLQRLCQQKVADVIRLSIHGVGKTVLRVSEISPPFR